MNRAERRKCHVTGRKHAWTTKSGSEYDGWLVCPDCGGMKEDPDWTVPPVPGSSDRTEG